MSETIIRKSNFDDLDEVEKVLSDVKTNMILNGIDQWDSEYPNREVLQKDCKDQIGFVLVENGKILSYMVLNEICDNEYYDLNWKYGTPFLVLHRLFVSPYAQGRGVSSEMIRYAERYALENCYQSIRLDAFSLNDTANNVYLKKGYEYVGEVIFRKGIFNCYEKPIVEKNVM